MSKFPNDPVINGYLNKIKDIEKEVFDFENPRIEHLVSKDKPAGLNEDTYIQVYRKQMAVFRHKIYLIMKNTGGRS
jgi:hypothetical protein